MGGHVQAIRDEGHRAPQQTADDFCDHHGAAEANYRPTAALVPVVVTTEKNVLVPPGVERVRVHFLPSESECGPSHVDRTGPASASTASSAPHEQSHHSVLRPNGTMLTRNAAA